MPFLSLSINKNIQFEQGVSSNLRVQTVQIEYKDVSNPLFRLFGGRGMPKTYFIELIPSENLVYDLANFKKSQTRQDQQSYAGARLIINLPIPPGSVLKLPAHLTCFIVDQDLTKITILKNDASTNDYTVIRPHTPASQLNKQRIVQPASLTPVPMVIDSKPDTHHKIVTPSIATSTTSTSSSSSASLTSTKVLPKEVAEEKHKEPKKAAPKQSKKPVTSKPKTNAPKKVKNSRLQKLRKSIKPISAQRKIATKQVEEHKKKIQKEKIAADAKPSSAPPTKRLKVNTEKPIQTTSSKPVALATTTTSTAVSEFNTGRNRLGSWITAQKAIPEQDRKIRPHQLKALEEYCNARGNVVFPMPTGSGKTFIMATRIQQTRDNRATLIVVPTTDLVAQTKQSINDHASNLKVEILKLSAIKIKKRRATILDEIQKKKSPEGYAAYMKSENDKHIRSEYSKAYEKMFRKNNVVITTYQTLDRHYIDLPWNKIEGIDFDEGHWLASARRGDVMLSYLKDTAKKEIRIFTATPICDDGNTFKSGRVPNMYSLLGYLPDGSNNPIQPVTIMQAIDLKIAPPVATGLLVLAKHATDNVVVSSSSEGEFSKKVISKLNKEAYVNKVVDFYLNGISPVDKSRLAEKRTIIICGSIEHAENVTNKLNAVKNQTAVCVHSKMDKEKRKDALHKAKSGQVNVLVGCDVLTEGYDDPEIELVIINRITKSTKLVTQSGGRGTRLPKEKQNKKVALIVSVLTSDIGGNYECFASNHFMKDGKMLFHYGEINYSPVAEEKTSEKYVVTGPMANAEMHWEDPGNDKLVIAKRVQPKKVKQIGPRPSPKSKPSKKRSSKIESDITRSIDDLKSMIDSLNLIFQGIKNIEIIEPEAAIPMIDIVDKNEEQQSKSIKLSTEEKPTTAPKKGIVHSIILTRRMKKALDTAENNISNIDNFLNPIRQALTGETSWASIRKNELYKKTKKSDTVLSYHERIGMLCEQARKMTKFILSLQKANYVAITDNVSGVKESILSDEITMMREDISELNNAINGLSSALTNNQTVLAENIKKYNSQKKAIETSEPVKKIKKNEYRDAVNALWDTLQNEKNIFEKLDKISKKSHISGIVRKFYKNDSSITEQTEEKTGNSLLQKIILRFNGLDSQKVNDRRSSKGHESKYFPLLNFLIRKTSINDFFTKKNKDGKSAWDLLDNHEDENCLLEIITYCVKAGYDFSPYLTILENAKMSKWIIPFIKKQWETPVDDSGNTILHFLDELKRKTREYLFSRPDLDVNVANDAGDTVAHILIKSLSPGNYFNTSKFGNNCVFKFIITLSKKEADLTIRNKNGQTPFHILLSYPPNNNYLKHLKLCPDLLATNAYGENIIDTFFKTVSSHEVHHNEDRLTYKYYFNALFSKDSYSTNVNSVLNYWLHKINLLVRSDNHCAVLPFIENLIREHLSPPQLNDKAITPSMAPTTTCIGHHQSNNNDSKAESILSTDLDIDKFISEMMNDDTDLWDDIAVTASPKQEVPAEEKHHEYSDVENSESNSSESEDESSEESENDNAPSSESERDESDEEINFVSENEEDEDDEEVSDMEKESKANADSSPMETEANDVVRNSSTSTSHSTLFGSSSSGFFNRQQDQVMSPSGSTHKRKYSR